MSEQEEAKIDIKGILANLIKTDEPELEQEEAIKMYKEKKSKHDSDDDSQLGSTEEQEHLQRVKQELLASLERVKKLEKKIYGEETKLADKKNIKTNSEGGNGNGQKQDKSLDENKVPKEQEIQKDNKQIERE